jgi:hypothetical protein
MHNVPNPNPVFGWGTKCSHSPKNAPKPDASFGLVTRCMPAVAETSPRAAGRASGSHGRDVRKSQYGKPGAICQRRAPRASSAGARAAGGS